MSCLNLLGQVNRCQNTRHSYDWGDVAVFMPCEKPSIEALSPDESGAQWPDLPPGIQPHQPELLQAVDIQMERQARHLTVTQIADLGTARMAADDKDRLFSRERFRRKVFHDAPNQIEQISDRKQGVSARQIGEIVHQALQHWRLPTGQNDEHLRSILEGYAWRQGITHKADSQTAVEGAFRLLWAFKNSDVFRWVDEARTVYRELPFVYRREGHIIHGIIDVLLRTRDDRWLILDYKTSTVKKAREAGALESHCLRYHLQVGVYAEAVQQQTGGATPQAYIHYIRYGRTIAIDEGQWRAALSHSLIEQILEVIEG